MLAVKVGVPPEVVMITLSLKVAVIDNTSPVFKKLFATPVAEVTTTEETVGAVVSPVPGLLYELFAASVASHDDPPQLEEPAVPTESPSDMEE